MSLARFVKANIPEPYTILGLRLRPFTLGAYLLMRRFNVGFAEDAERTTNPVELVKDFLLALVICSMRYEDFLEAITSDRFTVTTRRFGRDVTRTVSFRKWLGKWGREIVKASANDKALVLDRLGMFKEYLKTGMELPLFWEGDNIGDTRTTGAHWSQSVLLILVSELGYCRTDALNMPLSQAMADYFRYAERNGLVSLMSDEEIAQVEGQTPCQQSK